MHRKVLTFKALFNSQDNLLQKTLKLSPIHRGNIEAKNIKGVAEGYKIVGCLNMAPS